LVEVLLFYYRYVSIQQFQLGGNFLVIDINNEFASTLGEPRAKSATVRTSEHWLAKERMCWC